LEIEDLKASGLYGGLKILKETPETRPFVSAVGVRLGKGGLDNAFPFVLDAGVQLWQDWDNPRLPWDRKLRRAGLAGGIGLAGQGLAALTLYALGAEVTVPATIIVGIIVGLTVESWSLKLLYTYNVFDTRELPRKLQPLQ
jgi:hypothetical protein